MITGKPEFIRPNGQQIHTVWIVSYTVGYNALCAIQIVNVWISDQFAALASIWGRNAVDSREHLIGQKILWEAEV